MGVVVGDEACRRTWSFGLNRCNNCGCAASWMVLELGRWATVRQPHMEYSSPTVAVKLYLFLAAFRRTCTITRSKKATLKREKIKGKVTVFWIVKAECVNSGELVHFRYK